MHLNDEADTPQQWSCLSPPQEALWRHYRLNPDSRVYHLGGVLRFEGELDTACLLQALYDVIDRHEMLRVRFAERDGQVQQCVVPGRTLSLHFEDLSAERLDAAEVRNLARQQMQAPFALERGDVLRCRILGIAPQSHAVLLSVHHLVLDAWSMKLAIDDILRCYRHRLETHLPAEPLSSWSYTDYASHECEWLQGDTAQRLVRDRHRRREPVEEPLFDAPESSSRMGTAATHQLATFNAALTSSIDTLASRCQCSRTAVLLAAMQLLLSRFTGRHHFRLAMPGMNRSRITRRCIGYFVNTLLIDARIDETCIVSQWISQTARQMHDARRFERLPPDALCAGDTPIADPDVQVAFNYRKHGSGLRAGIEGLEVRHEELPVLETPFDLVLDIVASESLDVRLVCAEGRFDADFPARFCASYRALLEQFCQRPDLPLVNLSALTADQREQLHTWGEPTVGEPTAQARANSGEQHAAGPFDSLPAQIFRRAHARGDAVALVHGEQRWSYAHLRDESHRVAHYLVARGVMPESVVAVSLERGCPMISVMLGILEAGAAFLPLDPGYPADRLAYMLEDSGAGLLLSERRLATRLPTLAGVDRVWLDELDLECYSAKAPTVATIEPLQLAYLIYTSGSTGKPKGVAITHAGLAMHVRQIGERYAMSEDDVELHFASISFDGAVERWAVPLAFGSRLVIRDQMLWSVEQTCAVMQRERVTVVCFSPSFLTALLEWIERHQPALCVRSWTFAGEAVSRAAYERLHALVGAVRILNGYGPTETVITPLLWTGGGDRELDGPSAPIGTAVGSRRLYVLDEQFNLCPPGVPGELCIGGETGLARGYHARPAATAERFVPDPYTPRTGERMYRTGDRVRWNALGEVEYLGRLDRQLKVRGFRIEPGEIESQLLTLPGVRAAVVGARVAPGGATASAQLVGYVIAAEGAVLAIDTLRHALADKLPGHMVPAVLIEVQQLPLTPAGKIDQPALERLGQAVETPAASAPRGEAETVLARLWQSLLNITSVARTDEFLALGGDSIQALQLISRAREAGWTLQASDVFASPRLADMAARMQPVRTSDTPERGPLAGPVTLLPIQRRYLDDAQPGNCNQYVVLSLARAFDAVTLYAALGTLVRHHDALRLRFTRADDRWTARCIGMDTPVEDLVAFRDVDADTDWQPLADELHRELDVERGPLLAAIYQRAPEPTLWIAIHHLVVDGVSWRILLDDLDTACMAPEASGDEALPVRSDDISSWAEALDQSLRPRFEAERDHWHTLLQDAPVLFAAHDVHANTDDHAPDPATRREHLIDAPTLARWRQAGRRHARLDIEEFMLIALARALGKVSGRHDMLIHRESHGRFGELASLDLSRTVGWFTSVFPQRLTLSDGPTSTVAALKEQLRSVRDGGIGFGVLSNTIQTANRPLDVLFNHLGKLAGASGSTWSLQDSGLWRQAARPEAAMVVNLAERDDELHLLFEFDTQRLDDSLQARLIEQWLSCGEELAAHAETSLPILTPSDVPLVALGQTSLYQLDASVQTLLPLTSLQQGLLFHSTLEGVAGRYINQLALPLDGVDEAVFKQAWQGLAERHALLRASVAISSEADTLAIWPSVQLPWSTHDVSAAPDPQATADVQRMQRLERGFDVSAAPLWHVDLIKLAEQRHLCVFTVHHLLLDGWSTAIVLDELLALYAGHTLKQAGEYVDYLRWLQRHDPLPGRAFWEQRLAPVQAPTRLADHLGEAASRQQFMRHESGFSRAETDALTTRLRQQGLTLATLAQGAWALILSRCCEQNPVTFGLTVTGRPATLPGVERMVGLFINTLPMVVHIDGVATPRSWLAAIQADAAVVHDHEQAPLAELQALAGCSGESLFDTLLVVENYPLQDLNLEQRINGLKVGKPDSREFTHYPLTVVLLPGEQLQFLFAYDTARFNDTCIRELSATFRQLLRDLSTEAATALDAVECPIPVRHALPETAAGVAHRESASTQPAAFSPAEPPVPVPSRPSAASVTAVEQRLAGIWQSLLGIEAIGREDSFFALGGDSLLAMRVVSQLRIHHEMDLPLQALFEHPRLMDCAMQCQLRGSSDKPADSRDHTLPRADRTKPLLASAAQRRLWFVQQLQPDSGAWHIPLGLTIRGNLNGAKLQQALDILVSRHEILRTNFEFEEGHLLQFIQPARQVAIAFEEEESDSKIQQWLSAPFDLQNDPLLRIGMMQRSPTHHVMVLVQHHIITDGVGTRILLDELIDLYTALLDDQTPAIREPAIQYADFAQWQQTWLSGEAAQAELQWWRQQLDEEIEPLSLAASLPADSSGGGEPATGARHHFTLGETRSRDIRALTEATGCTAFSLMLALWQCLLNRYSQAPTLRIGVPVAARTHPGTETLPGCFVNTLVYSAHIDSATSFQTLAQANAQFNRAAQARQNLPFETLVEALGTSGALNHHPLYQVVFNLQHHDAGFFDRWPEAGVTPFDPGVAGVQMELALDIQVDTNGQFTGFISYDASRHSAKRIERMALHLDTLLEGMLADPAAPLAALPMEPAELADRHAALNRTAVDRGSFKALPLRLIEQARKTPDQIAVTMAGTHLTYRQLDQRIETVTRQLTEAGIGAEVRVAIGLPRSVDLVVGLHAIVRAGGAYVPLDASHPQERLAQMLVQSGCRLLITQSAWLSAWPEVPGLQIFTIDQPGLDVLHDTGAACRFDDSQQGNEPDAHSDHGDRSNAQLAALPRTWLGDQAIYVIFTSGSTGAPKGVINTHRALENRLLWMQEQFALTSEDCVLQKTPVTFDVSVWEFFWPLLTGARLVIAPPDAHRDPKELQQLIVSERVSTLHFVPSMLRAFVNSGHLPDCHSLKRIICSGEALDAGLVSQVHAAHDSAELHNLYGPTEAAIDVSHWYCPRERPEHQVENRLIPIGKPISNTRLYVLDPQLRPVPNSLPGELYIAGQGLARGYVARPDLTAARFLPDPDGPPGARMYRTGDRVYRRDDGEIVYLGRLDHQIKLRGMRIEPGEIEWQLQRLPGISEAVVVVHRHADEDHLVAYVVPAVPDASALNTHTGEHHPDDLTDTWRDALTGTLPDFMIPALITVVPSIPLSANGKRQLAHLPAPSFGKRNSRPPTTATEQALAELWSELLGSGSIGPDDNFFELGGHSLLAIRLLASIRERWAVEISVREFFGNPTLKAMAARIDAEQVSQPQRNTDELADMARLLDELEVS